MPDRHGALEQEYEDTIEGYHDSQAAYDSWGRHLADAEAALARARSELGQNPNYPTHVKAYEEALAADDRARQAFDEATRELAKARHAYEEWSESYREARWHDLATSERRAG